MHVEGESFGVDAYSEATWTPIPIDRGQSFQTMMDRVSDAMVNTFSVSIGMGVHDRGIGVAALVNRW